MSEPDDPPFGFGVCTVCDEDAEESDYDPRTRTTICARCREREPSTEDLFERAMSAKFPVRES